MAEMQIQINAEVTGAVQGLNQVQKELDQTGKSAAALSNSVVKASGAIAKLPQSAGQANQAITNLNRVVQDAPFGFVGIQNNIGPLIDSFGQLKMSTGSTGGALKALIGSLAGPAGVGLAVAGVSAALTFAIQGFSSWTRGLGAAKEANDKLAESLSMDLVKLTSIVGLAQNVSASTQDRAKAIQLLNEEYTKYLPSLDREAITLANVGEKYKIIVDAMLRQAVVKGLQETIAKQVEETARKVTALEIAREKERIGLEKGNKTKVNTLTVDQKLAQIANQKNKAVNDGTLALTRQTQAEKAAIGTTNVYEMMVAGLKTQLMESLKPALNLANAFTDLDQKLKPGKKAKVIEFDFTPIVGISAFSELVAKQAGPLAGIVTKEYQKALEKGFKDLKEVKVPFRINLSESAIKTKKELADYAKSFEDFNTNVNQIIQGIQVDAFASIGEAIGNALGGGEVGNAFQAFGNVIAAGLQAIGKQLLVVGGLAKLTKEALANLFTNPGLALAAGVGLIAAGAALKASLASGVKARALGGPVSGGEPYLVGERGPELFVPSVSGGIVPNNAVGSFMGGRMSGGNGSSIVRGQDILLAYARTQRSQLRVNG